MPEIKNARELATILHGLRMIQCEGRIEGCAAGDCEHFEDLAPLTNREIDRLCERINTLDGHVSCDRCGKDVEFYKAFLDHGVGPETGRLFTYCSTRCLKAH